MAVIKRKTKKAITKQVRKMVKKHGPEIALGLAASAVTGIVSAAAAVGDKKKGKKKQRRAVAK